MAHKIERDEVSGTDTTGHEWDGLKELDTPLPRWWVYIFYACIVAAVIYWVLMPAWPMVNGYTKGVLNYSDRREVAQEIGELRASRAPMFERLAHASASDIAADPELQEFARAAGESVFGDYCRTCHGAGGAGAPGYPNLADDVWLWGGTQADIEHTIRVGIRSTNPQARQSQMPAFNTFLTADQISDVTETVISMSAGRDRMGPNAQAALRGQAVFQQNCTSCHGATGQGDRAQGAPSLVDDVWLYGGTREEIRRQIEVGRNGVMPTWEGRFDDGTIRALSYYVYQMGGGEADAPPPPATQETQQTPQPAAPVAPGQ
ncbi:cytochrome-c oxidase, cbb3-type subunit III [Terricaulis sp.]|uniref:cytochrome-c oxidase, cbb3-type subunit III n=1 Tax=Terricaulis sp. TaxID=2768686 RepID=UPI003784F0D3